MKYSRLYSVIITLALMVLIPAGNVQALDYTDVGITFGTGFYQVVNDRRINGYNHNYGLNLQIFDDTQVGLYREFLKMEHQRVIELAGSPDLKIDTQVSIQINEIRVSRTVVQDLVEVILGFGWADIEVYYKPDSNSYDRGFVSLDVPVVDLLGRVTALKVNRKMFDARIYVDLGYRFMDIYDYDEYDAVGGSGDVVNDVSIDDLSGLFGNMGASIHF